MKLSQVASPVGISCTHNLLMSEISNLQKLIKSNIFVMHKKVTFAVRVA